MIILNNSNKISILLYFIIKDTKLNLLKNYFFNLNSEFLKKKKNNLRYLNIIFFKNLLIFFLLKKTRIKNFSRNFRFKISNYYKIKYNFFFKNSLFKLKKLFDPHLKKKYKINYKKYIYLNILKPLKRLILFFKFQKNILFKNFWTERLKRKSHFKYKYLFFKMSKILKTYRNTIFTFESKLKKKIIGFTFFFSVFIKKNNIFVTFRHGHDIIYQFSSGMLKVRGKKKRAPLTSTNLTKLLSIYAWRFLNFNKKIFKELKSKIKLNIYLYSYLNNPVVKSFLYVLKEHNFVVNKIFDKTKFAHSLGVKKKKIRRV